MVVYDAAGTDRQRTELGTMASGQSWQASLDLPASTLDDGDYGVWVFVTAGTAHNMAGPAVQEGVGFLIGRGRVYPSREHVDQRTFTTPPTLSPLRLEGSWIVFDMTNHETFDIEVSHEFAISLEGSVDPQKFRGLELVRAEATQHGHYLLPDHLAGGRYLVSVTLQNEGSDLVDPASANIQVDGDVITLVCPTSDAPLLVGCRDQRSPPVVRRMRASATATPFSRRKSGLRSISAISVTSATRVEMR